MTFKDVKPRSWEDCLAAMAEILAEAYGDHAYLLTDGSLDSEDAEVFAAIRQRRAEKAQLTAALRLLSAMLARRHGEKVVILIDEYDTPIHAGHTHRYYDEGAKERPRERPRARPSACASCCSGNSAGASARCLRRGWPASTRQTPPS
jgi:hypothetical protein